MTIGEAIKKYRKGKGLTQTELAQAIGYKDRSSITKIEKDINCPPLSTLRKFAEILEVDVWEIIGFNEVEMDDAELTPELNSLITLLRTFSPEELRRVHDFALGLIATRQ